MIESSSFPIVGHMLEETSLIVSVNESLFLVDLARLCFFFLDLIHFKKKFRPAASGFGGRDSFAFLILLCPHSGLPFLLLRQRLQPASNSLISSLVTY